MSNSIVCSIIIIFQYFSTPALLSEAPSILILEQVMGDFRVMLLFYLCNIIQINTYFKKLY